jgi:hypothetical protein
MTPALRLDLADRKSELLEYLAHSAAPEQAAAPGRRVDPNVLSDRDFEAPIAWRGEELQPNAGFVQIDAECKDEVEGLAAQLQANPRPHKELRPDDFELPELRRVMGTAKRELEEGIGFAVIDRLDPVELGSDVARSIYWLLASMLARPVALRLDGRMMRDVCDLGKRSQRAVDTTAEMHFHTDNSYNPAAPDFVALLCLQEAKEGGMSKLVSFPAVHNELRRRNPERLMRLYDPFVFNRVGLHAPGDDVTIRRPIFEQRDGNLVSHMSHFHVRTGHALAGEPLAPESEAAMDEMEAIMNEPGMGHEFWFEPGQIQILDNRRIGHRRTGFIDWPEPERKRRLVRMWMRDSGGVDYNG